MFIYTYGTVSEAPENLRHQAGSVNATAAGIASMHLACTS